MRDLDQIIAADNWLGNARVADPEHAWAEAAAEVIVSISYVRDQIVQLGYNADGSGDIWMRSRGGTEQVWTGWVTAGSSRGGLVGFGGNFTNGSAAVVLPDYIALEVSGSAGSIATVEGGSLRIADGGSIAAQFQMTVTHNWGSSVVIGYGIDGAAPVELVRQKIDSNDPILIMMQQTLSVTGGSLVTFYISSDFEWQAFAWMDGQLLVTALA